MRNLFKLALLLVAACSMFGCAHNYYSVPQAQVEKKVKVIGIAPFFVDPDSDVRHPDKGAILSLMQGYNAKNEKEFIARLRGSGIFYAVRQIEGDPARIFSNVVASRERRDDAGIIYNKYFYKRDALKQLMSENGLDAVLFVTVSGLTRQEKVYSSNFLSYLDTDFNYLTLTAQMLDAEGTVLWEYPNFKRSALSYSMFFPLQYPDFDEAAANLSEKVDVKYKTVAGVAAAFKKGEPSAGNGPVVSTLYVKQYDEMLSLLKPYKPMVGGSKETSASAPAAMPAAAAAAPEAAAVQPAPEGAAPVTEPVTQPAAIEAAAPAAAVQAAPEAAPPAAAEKPLAAPAPLSSGDIAPEQQHRAN
jgi:hypothetical protein